MNEVRKFKATQKYKSNFSVVEDFPLERFQQMDEGNRMVVPGPAHCHPDPEYLEPYPGYNVRINYISNGEVSTILSGEGIEVAGNVPHRVFLLGPTRIYTTKDNLSEGKRNTRPSLYDFLREIEET